MIILLLLIMGASYWVQANFKRSFNKFSKIPNQQGLNGAEVAQQMLDYYKVNGVTITRGQGMLTDHYNPKTKTVSLSPEVYDGRSVISAAVAAHEVGHAIQHATAYSWLQFRSAIVPAVMVTNKFTPWLLMIGIVTVTTIPYILGIGILFFALTTFFSFITLPVEFDASKRALAWLDNTNVTSNEEHQMAKKSLNLAAQTYVIAAISSLATLLYYVMIFLSRRD
jgi:Zn-dependent membrane protease YugP